MTERMLVPLEYYQKATKWAVIVGISEYMHQPWNLDYAHRDAEELSKLLQTENGGNFKPDNIRLLTNQKATKSNLIDALRDFLRYPSKDDLVLLYFACHRTDNPKIPRICSESFKRLAKRGHRHSGTTEKLGSGAEKP